MTNDPRPRDRFGRFAPEPRQTAQDGASCEIDDSRCSDYLAERGASILARDGVLGGRRQAILAAREKLFADRIASETVRLLKPGWLKAQPYKGRKAKRVERVIQAAWGDWHLRANLKMPECPVRFGPHEEARRIGKVTAELADYKREHRGETRLIVNILGDMIEGIIHASGQDTLPVQMAAFTHSAAAALHFLASEYQQVDVYCVSGNHGREPSIHPERPVWNRANSIEHAAYTNLATLLFNSGHDNIKFHIPTTQWAVTEFCGHRGFVIHGDTVFKLGKPSARINTDALFRQICAFNLARNIHGPFATFLGGHIHFWSVTNPLPMSTMITNSALIPPAHFALSIGAMDIACSQFMWESTPDYAVGDMRRVDVDDADGCAEYEKIIPVYKGELEPRVRLFAA